MNRDLDEELSPPRSRSSSRRNSASSRRSSIKKDKEGKTTMSSVPSSANSTPKKSVKQPNLDFVVTGKQILKRGDRANSLPGSYRRPSTDSIIKSRKQVETKRVNERVTERVNASQSSKSQETSLEDDMSLDLSQVSDFEDTNSKYGIRKFQPLTTSTPKVPKGKPRSASLQSQIHSQRVETRRALKSLGSVKQSFSCSRDSFKTNSSRYGTDLDYSSVSPEYSGQSSTDMSPRTSQDQVVSPRSQDMQVSSCCISTWADCSDADTKVEHRCDGEWSSFWANYNNSLAKVPMKNYYDQCPTPYRTETFDLADFGELDLADGSRMRSPDNIDMLNNIIRNQGLHLTPRETQNIIKCAHLLGNVLSKAIERRTKTDPEDPELNTRKKTMTLDLKETVIPLEVKEEKRSETVTTQTDISLPNTKSAPRIFENILRQLSRSSIDVSKIEIKDKTDDKAKNKDVAEKEKNVLPKEQSQDKPDKGGLKDKVVDVNEKKNVLAKEQNPDKTNKEGAKDVSDISKDKAVLVKEPSQDKTDDKAKNKDVAEKEKNVLPKEQSQDKPDKGGLKDKVVDVNEKKNVLAKEQNPDKTNKEGAKDVSDISKDKAVLVKEPSQDKPVVENKLDGSKDNNGLDQNKDKEGSQIEIGVNKDKPQIVQDKTEPNKVVDDSKSCVENNKEVASEVEVNKEE